MVRRSRHKGDAAIHHAEALRATLMEARPAGLEMPQLMRSTERTQSQVRSGLAMLRDLIAGQGVLPLRYSCSDGYQFTSDPLELQECEAGMVHQKLTEIRRLLPARLDPPGRGRCRRARRPAHHRRASRACGPAQEVGLMVVRSWWRVTVPVCRPFQAVALPL
ncbi:hypothetical protein [Streptomyces sp. NPDC050264]|uniref:hypothetical protein n=1 Tax=Streptomyces sp. NPDC050264 TaxID=3155038 RepID=UPI00341DF777